jgi:hypothetical protein
MAKNISYDAMNNSHRLTEFFKEKEEKEEE